MMMTMVDGTEWEQQGEIQTMHHAKRKVAVAAPHTRLAYNSISHK